MDNANDIRPPAFWKRPAPQFGAEARSGPSKTGRNTPLPSRERWRRWATRSDPPPQGQNVRTLLVSLPSGMNDVHDQTHAPGASELLHAGLATADSRGNAGEDEKHPASIGLDAVRADPASVVHLSPHHHKRVKPAGGPPTGPRGGGHPAPPNKAEHERGQPGRTRASPPRGRSKERRGPTTQQGCLPQTHRTPRPPREPSIRADHAADPPPQMRRQLGATARSWPTIAHHHRQSLEPREAAPTLGNPSNAADQRKCAECLSSYLRHSYTPSLPPAHRAEYGRITTKRPPPTRCSAWPPLRQDLLPSANRKAVFSALAPGPAAPGAFSAGSRNLQPQPRPER